MAYSNRLKGFLAYANACLVSPFQAEGMVQELEQTLSLINEFKGVFLIGNPGGGKTFILDCVQRLISQSDPRFFLKKTSLDIVLDYNLNGHEALSRYRGQNIWIDDVGAEYKGKHFGDTVEVMELLIQKRYEDFRTLKSITHFTSNLSPKELGERYGMRVHSRLKEFSNFILIGASETSKDFRSLKNFKGYPRVGHKVEESEDDRIWRENYQRNCELAKEHAKNNRESRSLGNIAREAFGNPDQKSTA